MKTLNNQQSKTIDMTTQKQIYNGGAAFPKSDCIEPDMEPIRYGHGMSLRDYFAAAALQGLIQQRQEKGDADRPSAESIEQSSVGLVYVGSFIGYKGEGDEYEAARDAYKFADAMLAARKEGA
jgi:hypothetical protein